MIKRVDAISQVVFDPTGRTTGQFYPANATHWRGQLIRKRSRNGDFAPVSPVKSTRVKVTLPFDERK